MHNRWLKGAVILIGAMLVFYVWSCDWTYHIDPPLKHLDGLGLVSVYPGFIDNNGNMQPICYPEQYKNTEPNGFIVNFIAQSAGQRSGDSFIFPGDVVAQIQADQKKLTKLLYADQETNLGAGRFQVNVDCLSSIHSNKFVTACDGVKGPSIDKTIVNFKSFFECREPDSNNPNDRRVCYHHYDRNEVGVIVMFDDSGSMDGWVDPATYQEVGKHGSDLNNNEDRATDQNWNAREAAWNTFTDKLNPKYKRMVLRFGEFASEGNDTSVLAGCVNPNQLTYPKLWDNCFGINTSAVDMTKLKQPYKDASNITKGRTPLWKAVKKVYDYLKTQTNLKVKHIIVVDDSPDTCSDKSPFYNWALGAEHRCSDVSYEDFKKELLQDLANGQGKDIHISFVQVQSKGYMERDPQQMEAACLTSGHYMFINAREWGDGLDKYNADLSYALKQAMTKLAYSLQGYWQYGFSLLTLNDGKTIPPGTFAAAAGKLTLKGGDPDSLMSRDTYMYFQIGDHVDKSKENTGNEQTNALRDNRLVIRIPCKSGSGCSIANTDYPCSNGKCTDADNKPVTYLDESCVETKQCVSSLGLCHWQYKGDGGKCSAGTCSQGLCKGSN